jgi:hypothetical protein
LTTRFASGDKTRMRAPLVLSLLLSAPGLSAAKFEVRVTAPGTDLPMAVVSAEAPAGFPQVGVLKNDATEIPFQKSGANTVTFILSKLRSGESRNFTVKSDNPSQAAVAQRKNDAVTLLVGGKQVFTYHGAETELPRADIKPIFKRGAYIHPILSPSGRRLTDDYPPNHLHHHGLWMAWTKTIFDGRQPDFWNMGDAKGRVEFVKLDDSWSGPVHAGLTAEHRYIDLTSGQAKPALNESWTVTAYSVPGADYFVFDLVATQTCATSAPLELPKYYYGGLGFRGNWGWNGEDKCFFLNSNGETDRIKGNETRGNWCHIGGEVEGGRTGIAILCHPDNFGAPQPMREHPKEPFFCYAPSELGDFAIEPGKPYIGRYRFIVKDGEPDKAQLDALWQGYAHPPQVAITQKQ